MTRSGAARRPGRRSRRCGPGRARRGRRATSARQSSPRARPTARSNTTLAGSCTANLGRHRASAPDRAVSRPTTAIVSVTAVRPNVWGQAHDRGFRSAHDARLHRQDPHRTRDERVQQQRATRESNKRRGSCARCCSGPALRRPRSPRRAERMLLLGSRPRRRRSRLCSRTPNASCTPEPSRLQRVGLQHRPTRARAAR